MINIHVPDKKINCLPNTKSRQTTLADMEKNRICMKYKRPIMYINVKYHYKKLQNYKLLYIF